MENQNLTIEKNVWELALTQSSTENLVEAVFNSKKDAVYYRTKSSEKFDKIEPVKSSQALRSILSKAIENPEKSGTENIYTLKGFETLPVYVWVYKNREGFYINLSKTNKEEEIRVTQSTAVMLEWLRIYHEKIQSHYLGLKENDGKKYLPEVPLIGFEVDNVHHLIKQNEKLVEEPGAVSN